MLAEAQVPALTELQKRLRKEAFEEQCEALRVLVSSSFGCYSKCSSTHQDFTDFCCQMFKIVQVLVKILK